MSANSAKGTALITGASAGIGAVYAERLARRGFDLTLVARDANRLGELADRLTRETGAKIEVLPADLTAKSGVASVETRLRSDESITLLVNNAGVALAGSLTAADPDDIDAVIQLNVTAASRLGVAAASAFAARGRGAIVNIASVLALAPEISNGVYSGTKAYILNFSQALHQELSPRGVQVQVVLPGATRTEIWQRAGIDIGRYDPSMIMEAGEMVDAALVGFDRKELVTIPSMPNAADWDALNEARIALRPNLSKDHAARRYANADPVAA
jgi:hypothetical protein